MIINKKNKIQMMMMMTMMIIQKQMKINLYIKKENVISYQNLQL